MENVCAILICATDSGQREIDAISNPNPKYLAI